MSRSLGQVLYSGMGNQFEQFLAPEQLHILGSVSTITRDTEPNLEFRAIIQFMLDNLTQLRDYPLRSLVKQFNEEQGTSYNIRQLYDVAEYMWNVSARIDTYTLMLMRAEVGLLEEVKANITDLYHICHYSNESFESDEPYEQIVKEADYDEALLKEAGDNYYSFSMITRNLLNSFADRFAITCFQYVVVYIKDDRYRVERQDPAYCYPISPEIREIVVSEFPRDVESEIEDSDVKDAFGYGLSNSIESFLTTTLGKAVKFQDYDLFLDYAKQYFNKVDEVYLKRLFSMSPGNIAFIDEDEIIIRLGGYKV